MLILSRSARLPQFYQSNKIAGIPTSESKLVKTRLHTFLLFTEPLRIPTMERCNRISDEFSARYRLPFDEQTVLAIYKRLLAIGWCQELIKVAFLEVFPILTVYTFVTEKEVAFVTELRRNEQFDKDYKELISFFEDLNSSITFDVKECYKTFIEGIAVDPEKVNPSKEVVQLGSILWVAHMIWFFLDGEFIPNALSTIIPDTCYVLRKGNLLGLYNYDNNAKWIFCELDYRDTLDRRSPMQNAGANVMLDERIFFGYDKDSNKLILHADIVPVVKFYTETSTEIDINELEVGRAYRFSVTYPYVETHTKSIITFKPLIGCTFKDNERILENGSVLDNQILVNSNIVKFKVADKTKILPWKFFQSEKRLRADSIKWLT